MTVSVTQTCRDVSELAPNAQLAIRAFFYELNKAGINVFVTETYRSQARQNYLYEQGRSRSGQIVTWTRSSRHTSRLAWDTAVCSPANLYDTATLNKAGAIAKKLGITWGGDWGANIDRPHFEISANWRLPAAYNIDVINGVLVPSTSTGKVVLTVADNIRYDGKIGYNVMPNALKFRLLSGPFANKAQADAKVTELLTSKSLAYAEPKQGTDGKWRVQSGAYTTLEQAEIAAKHLIDKNRLGYASINGTIK